MSISVHAHICNYVFLVTFFLNKCIVTFNIFFLHYLAIRVRCKFLGKKIMYQTRSLSQVGKCGNKTDFKEKGALIRFCSVCPIDKPL